MICCATAASTIRIEKNGTSNIPVVQGATPRKPARETLFDLHIRRLQLQNGWILYNDVRTPLAVEGDNLRLALDYVAGPRVNRCIWGQSIGNRFASRQSGSFHGR